MTLNMNYATKIATQLNIPSHSVPVGPDRQVQATIELLDAGNTLPFIARYRKEATGGLDEEQIRQISKLVESLRALDERRESIVASIQEQGMLTEELHQQLLAAETRTELEDLYQPYKRKRRTRASIARERGLQGLADLILAQEPSAASPDELALAFLNEEVPDAAEALAGARDIIAETISDHPEVRRLTRERAQQWATLRCEKIAKAEDPRGVYETYYDFECRVDRLRPHQALAIARGEAEKVLRVHVDVPERDWRAAVGTAFRPQRRSPLAAQMELAIADAAQRLLLPAIERDVRRLLDDQAERHAIAVFATNLRALLNQPPLTGHTVLGIDPGYRTGCKVAVVDPTGKVLNTATIHPHPPQKEWQQAQMILAALIRQHQVTLMAIGNGTASRESEQLAAELILSDLVDHELHYLMVNEAGASVYSASPLARAELPDLDVSIRGAVSIARRVQDPLAELVKIEPRSIGVGMYQHDIDQNQLTEALSDVVESAVNQVGVDVNTASPALLTYVAGVGPRLAERIVAYRDERGPFPNRKALLKVPGLGPKAFEQAAGFLRIRDGDNPLDASAIHPESYSVAEAVLKRAGLTAQTPPAGRQAALDKVREQHSLEELAAELGAGVPTLSDIFEQLVRPGRDPREDLPAPVLRSDVLSMEDLKTGMRLQGTVRNVVDFGAFVDIGVKQDGLLHRSQYPFATVISVGDVIGVEVLNVDLERGRIGLGWGSGS